MRVAAAFGMLAGMVGTAIADGDGTDLELVHLRDSAEQRALPEATLVLDPVVRPNIEGLDNADTHHRRTFELDRRTRIVTDTVERASDLDVASRGWRVSGWLHRDLGFAWLSVGGSVENVESRSLAAGLQSIRPADMSRTYYEVGVALTRSFQLFGKASWLALSLGKQQWLGGQPPPGESNGWQLMLGFGFTF